MATAKKPATSKTASPGHFVLENKRGEVVRIFRWESTSLVVVYRLDNRRIETFRNITELNAAKIPHRVLAETTPAQIKKAPLNIASIGQIRYVSNVDVFGPEYDLPVENTLEPKVAYGYSAMVQLALAGILIIGSVLFTEKKEPEAVVTLLSEEQVKEMLAEKPKPTPQPEPQKVAKNDPPPPPPPKKKKEVIVQASETKINKKDPIPTKSTSFKKTKIAKVKPKGGGYKGDGRRGNGTNERDMNSIGVLGALNKRGNGGRGGVNLQAVGNDNGSGAGGSGRGGYGNDGAGGSGRGGLGRGRSQGLSNAMYGRGLMAASFGEGSAAPGSGGYGTRGKAGGGAQGSGYGSETVVGSWKGTGPKGIGSAGSGDGSGRDGSPFGFADGDEGDAVVTGGLDMDAVNAVIRRNMGQITYCYEQGLQKKSSLAGRVTVRWNIGASGRVNVARIGSSSVRSAQVERCIAGKVKNWQFPKPHGGVTVAVAYPFVLSRQAR